MKNYRMNQSELAVFFMIGVLLNACGLPTGSKYRTPASSYSAGDSNSGNSTNTLTGTYGNSTSSATDSTPTTESSPIPVSTPTAPTCVFTQSPEIKPYGMNYYLQSSLTVTASVPVSYVTLYAVTAWGGTSILGSLTASPYTFNYLVSGTTSSVVTFYASIVMSDGRSYPSVCNQAYRIN